MAHVARSIADRDRIEALELQCEELRQFCVMLILNLPNRPGQATMDDWWEKLGSYPKVEDWTEGR